MIFLHLTQGSKSAQHYSVEFNEKPQIFEHQVNTEERKINKYIWGLKTNICKFLQASKDTTLCQVVEVVNDREVELKRQEPENKEESEVGREILKGL